MKNGASTSNGWKTVRLAEIDRHVHRTLNPLDYPDEVFEYYSIPAFQASGKPTLERGEAILSNKLLVESRMVLFGKLNPEVLKVWLVNSESEHRKIASTEFLPILATEDAHPEFLYYLCQSGLVVEEAKQLVSGSTPSRQRVEARSFYNIVVPLPPLPEQRAIARVLRAVQAAREARQREVSLERERKAALMAHLFTHGTRGESTKQTPIGEMPRSWEVVRLAKCAYIQTGTTKGRRFKDGEPTIEVPYLRVANVQDGYLDLSEIKNIEIRADEYDRFRLQAGDVLMTEGGDADKLGRGFIWNNEIAGCVHQNHVFAVRVNKDLLTPEFLSYQTQSPYGKAYFLNVGHRTTNLASINSTKLGAYPVLLAPRDEQERIVDILSACDAKIAALERESALLDELFRALLEELMTGRAALAEVEEGNG